MGGELFVQAGDVVCNDCCHEVSGRGDEILGVGASGSEWNGGRTG